MTSRGASKRILLKDHAYRRLKKLLLDGVYAPGTFLSERQLAEEMGMSKTPIRAALERVEAEGYVTVSPQQGIVVNEMSLREIKEHYEIRMALEPFIVQRLAGRLTDQQIKALEENLTQQLVCIQNQDTLGHVGHDRDFHLLLAAFLDNREILRVMELQKDKAYRVTSQISLDYPPRMADSFAEHQAIFGAMRDGDGDRAADHMRHHLRTGREFVLSV